MKPILAELITIGDEILYGQTLDTNAHWMSYELSAIGVKVIRRTTCGDQEAEILKALSEAEGHADIILITGGLGPTSDDLTKPCMARYFNCEITVNQQALAELEAYMASRNRPLNKLTRLQASLPEACEMVSNERGTAPGMWFNKSGKIFVAMPGVPNEMKHMMTFHVLPKIKNSFSLPVIYHKIVRVAGIGESWLAELIEPWEKALPSNIKLAYLPTYSDLKLRLTAFGDDKKALKTQVDELVTSLLPLIEPYHYGYDDDSLEIVIGKILRNNHETLAIAESCTGGFIAHRITSVAGSSDYFAGAITPYQNEIKIKILGVKEATIASHGAVSEQTVSEMAESVRVLFGADYGLATSGIAGPGGGTDEKPVGTVWIACADRSGVVTKKLVLTKDRDVNIRMSAVAAMNLLYQRLPKNR
ncbi:MAG: competence/damage-inducible protein A [Cyclobacteriaceae bacterium]|nr:competence/damage-inducible protein A [Cyclobacteriaceae bacterium]